MKITDIVDIINGEVICGHEQLDRKVTFAFSSDLLSDVLTINKAGILLITGVANMQTIRTADVAEVSCVLLVRGKKASSEMVSLAQEIGVVIIESKGSMFGTSGRLYESGVKPLY
jgi:predicted transcriptional regulator